MDSITQASLGAAVGYLCWQDKLGKKSLVAGAAIGTLPDLDILLYPLLDEVQRLYWHRGESHSIWFILLGTIGLARLLKITKVTRDLHHTKAMSGVFLILLTHVLIDLFTVYGTQLLAPVSRHGFALGNMFIIDPLFTFPLVIGIVGAYFLDKKPAAIWVNQSGLLLATLYAFWSLPAQAVAHQNFRSALEELDFKVSRQVTSASPFNTLLWRHIAEVPDGFLLGYWSWLDQENRKIRFQFIPKNREYTEQIISTRAFEAVEWFSKGWWFAVRSDNNTIKVVDLRFTEIPSPASQSYKQWQWPFAWVFHPDTTDDNRLIAIRPEMEEPAKTLTLLGRRIQGQSGWIIDTERRVVQH